MIKILYLETKSSLELLVSSLSLYVVRQLFLLFSIILIDLSENLFQCTQSVKSAGFNQLLFVKTFTELITMRLKSVFSNNTV